MLTGNKNSHNIALKSAIMLVSACTEINVNLINGYYFFLITILFLPVLHWRLAVDSMCYAACIVNGMVY